MGGEGVMWLGQQPFTDEAHVFANMGDGTFFHSGFLAIRQAIAAQLPITYKLLVNGVVAMTGGQPIEGSLSVRQMVDVLLAEGVGKLILVTDDITDYPRGTLPPAVPVRDRSEFEAVQKECRAFPGVSVIIYQQPCATERRRLRKRGQAPDLRQDCCIGDRGFTQLHAAVHDAVRDTAQRAAAARNLFDIHLAGALQRREVRRGGGSWGVVDGGKAGGLALHAAQRSGRMPNLRKT